MTSAELSAYIARREVMLGAVRDMLIARLRVPRQPDEIDPDTPLFGTGLGLDSIDAVELLICLDTEFGVMLPNDTTGRGTLRTVNSLVDLALAAAEATHAGA